MFEFDIYAPEVDSDPFPLYKTLRDQYPVYWCETAKKWVLTRYDDVANAMRDWETYSSAKGNIVDEMPGRAGSTLGTTDPPRHDRLRNLVAAAFAKRNVEYLVEPARKLASDALEALGDAGELEFIDDFSSVVTVGIIFQLLGLPPGDHTKVRQKVISAIRTDAETHMKTQESIDDFNELVDYVKEQVAIRLENPTEDLISALAEAEIDGDKLTDSEVVMTSVTLIIAGVESLSSFLAMFALNMATYPDSRRRVVADRSLLLGAIEESVRFNTSAQRFRRILTRDVELHGQTMKKGDFVVLCYGAGNRDERKFRNPDVYDIERNPRGHLGFGGGKHLCLGAPVARVIIEAVFDEFFNKFPEFYVGTEELVWTPSTTFRSPIALPLVTEKLS